MLRVRGGAEMAQEEIIIGVPVDRWMSAMLVPEKGPPGVMRSVVPD